MPKWAITIAGLLICTLASISTGMAVYIFLGVSNKVDLMAADLYTMRNQIEILKINLDTNNHLCRFPHKKDE